MLRNYLKIGFRNLVKNKLFTLINISGMAISIASFLIIALFIHDEYKFDSHVEDASLKYRVYTKRFGDDGATNNLAMIPPMITPTLKAEYPEVESYVRFLNINSNVLFEVGDKKVTEGKGGYADPSIIEMFSLKLVEGDSKTALINPHTMAISKSIAKKYFDNKPALGEVIEVADESFTVTAVYEDFPIHSHLQLNYFLSMETLINELPERMKSWGWSQFHSYIKLRSGADAAQLEAKLKRFAERHAWPQTKPSGFYYIPHLMPLQDIHLKASDHMWDIAVRGSDQTVYILLATSIFIIIIAILNFINLSTARAISRVKEVGVRKVVGAVRLQLIYQFISESIIIAIISLLIGGLATELLLPSLNSFTDKSIPTGIFLNPLLVLLILTFAVIIGIAAGAYPAFYISAYKPAHILSNKQSGRSGKNILRKGLVVLQFILAFFLITAALVVSNQHKFMRTKDMGFDKDNVIIIPLRADMRKNFEATKNSFLDNANVLAGSLGYGLPGEAYAGDIIIDQAKEKEWPVSLLNVDYDYIKTLDLKLLYGRDFSKEYPSDEREAFIISEAATKLFGYTDPKDALNHQLAWNRWDAPDSLKKGKVIGIVKDFHLNSLHEKVTPIVIHVYPFAYSTLTLRIKPENVPATIAHFESTWQKFNTEWPFEYRFLDDNFDKLYKAEEKLATLFTFFTGFTIFVACLGLFGLVAYSTAQRFKEISIRKVLGAGESTLVVQLTKSYMFLIAIAFIIAIPFSYYAAYLWLQKFAFRIDITASIFIKAGVLILLISLLTVGIQSYLAARANPVNALKEN